MAEGLPVRALTLAGPTSPNGAEGGRRASANCTGVLGLVASTAQAAVISPIAFVPTALTLPRGAEASYPSEADISTGTGAALAAAAGEVPTTGAAAAAAAAAAARPTYPQEQGQPWQQQQEQQQQQQQQQRSRQHHARDDGSRHRLLHAKGSPARQTREALPHKQEHFGQHLQHSLGQGSYGRKCSYCALACLLVATAGVAVLFARWPDVEKLGVVELVLTKAPKVLHFLPGRGPATSSSTTGVPTFAAPLYDCNGDVSKWTLSQQYWCCKKTRVGCATPHSTTLQATSSAAFNKDTGAPVRIVPSGGSADRAEAPRPSSSRAQPELHVSTTPLLEANESVTEQTGAVSNEAEQQQRQQQQQQQHQQQHHDTLQEIPSQSNASDTGSVEELHSENNASDSGSAKESLPTGNASSSSLVQETLPTGNASSSSLVQETLRGKHPRNPVAAQDATTVEANSTAAPEYNCDEDRGSW
eukprot:CAMPEP_0172781006 /NCGR_PEP_ID=MMETSP1074-20121228/203203_1 /TAXON_ID=2916 /ORGANISM="Ceratium fusus, Strain PA161109" /LENGTH=472 /DNA_ID=CAMNT_0013617983 /DNA_START=76 /DNA_END=1493 /DNA_ORIENTATION=-